MKQSITPEQDQSKRYSEYNSYAEHHFYAQKVISIYNWTENIGYYYLFDGLDVGCADGSFAVELMKVSRKARMIGKRPIHMHGIDISYGAVMRANQNGVEAKVHNLEKKMPYKDNSFDLVTGCEIIEHLYDTDFFLSEIYRVLNKRGLVILTTPNLVSLPNRIKMLFGLYPDFVPEYRVGGGKVS